MKKKWYVIKTLSRSEKKTISRLELINYECFLPLVKTIKQWSDRKKKVEEPLIPGVVFVYCFENELSTLYNIPSIHSILKFLNKPAIVKDQEIQNLKILTNQSIDLINKENVFYFGDIVKIIKGPFTGLIGSCLKDERNYKLFIQIESLNHSFSINISKSFVKSID